MIQTTDMMQRSFAMVLMRVFSADCEENFYFVTFDLLFLIGGIANELFYQLSTLAVYGGL